jgi:magnesium-transporting ATPase (P-type)
MITGDYPLTAKAIAQSSASGRRGTSCCSARRSEALRQAKVYGALSKATS